MSVAAELISKATLAGARLEARGERLHIAAAAPLAAEIVDALREHKPEVLAVLRDRSRDAAIVRWMNDNPSEIADQDRCAACGGVLLDDLLPLALRDRRDMAVWVHGACFEEYRRQKRKEAEEAIDRMEAEGQHDAS